VLGIFLGKVVGHLITHLSWISENLNVEGTSLMGAVEVEVLRKAVPWMLAKG